MFMIMTRLVTKNVRLVFWRKISCIWSHGFLDIHARMGLPSDWPGRLVLGYLFFFLDALDQSTTFYGCDFASRATSHVGPADQSKRAEREFPVTFLQTHESPTTQVVRFH